MLHVFQGNSAYTLHEMRFHKHENFKHYISLYVNLNHMCTYQTDKLMWIARTYSDILRKHKSMYLSFERAFESNISYNSLLEASNHLVCFSTIFKYFPSVLETPFRKFLRGIPSYWNSNILLKGGHRDLMLLLKILYWKWNVVQ